MEAKNLEMKTWSFRELCGMLRLLISNSSYILFVYTPWWSKTSFAEVKTKICKGREPPDSFGKPVIWYKIAVKVYKMISDEGLYNFFVLTHCGLVTSYGNIDLGQHWLR